MHIAILTNYHRFMPEHIGVFEFNKTIEVLRNL